MAKVDEKKELTPLEKMELRTGGCVAIACSYGCDAYAFTKMMDGFPTCVCGHTQHAHSNYGAVIQ